MRPSSFERCYCLLSRFSCCGFASGKCFLLHFPNYFPSAPTMKKPYGPLLVASTVCLSGCTVYAPMQPLMPVVRTPGAVELGASLQGSGRLELGAVYAPVSHVVVTGAGTISPKLSKDDFLVTRQYELGAGLYHPLNDRWLINGLGGYGQAYSNRGYLNPSFFGPATFSEYEARYSKYFGQLSLAHTQASDFYGLTYRLTQVRFLSLLETTTYGPLPLEQMVRHELLFFYRHGLSRAAATRWQLQAALGMSVSSTPELNEHSAHASFEGWAERHANRVLGPAFLGSVGVVYALPGRTTPRP